MESSVGELVLSGVNLMLIGMVIVFLFLALLVWVIGATSKLINRYSPEPPTCLSPPSLIKGDDEAESDEDLVAAVSAAIHRYQNN